MLFARPATFRDAARGRAPDRSQSKKMGDGTDPGSVELASLSAKAVLHRRPSEGGGGASDSVLPPPNYLRGRPDSRERSYELQRACSEGVLCAVPASQSGVFSRGRTALPEAIDSCVVGVYRVLGFAEGGLSAQNVQNMRERCADPETVGTVHRREYAPGLAPSSPRTLGFALKPPQHTAGPRSAAQCTVSAGSSFRRKALTNVPTLASSNAGRHVTEQERSRVLAGKLAQPPVVHSRRPSAPGQGLPLVRSAVSTPLSPHRHDRNVAAAMAGTFPL